MESNLYPNTTEGNLQEVYDWLKNKREGSTPLELRAKFPNYNKAINKLKQRKDLVFYEEGIWYTWE